MECYLVHTGTCDVAGYSEVGNLSETQRRVLFERSGMIPPDGSLICHGHYKNLLLVCSTFYKSCSAPYGPHRKAVTEGFRIVTLQEYDRYSCLKKRIIPGRKLCTNCIKKLNSELEEYDN